MPVGARGTQRLVVLGSRVGAGQCERAHNPRRSQRILVANGPPYGVKKGSPVEGTPERSLATTTTTQHFPVDATPLLALQHGPQPRLLRGTTQPMADARKREKV